MNRFQNMLKDRMFVRYGVFIVFTATLLYIIYSIINNISSIAGATWTALDSLSAALSPMVIGLVIAYIINPLVTFAENKVGRRLIRSSADPVKSVKRNRQVRVFSVLLTYVFLILVLILFLYGLAALLLGRLIVNISLSEVYDTITTYITTYEQTIRQWVSNLPQGLFAEQLDNLLQNVIKWFADNFSAENAMNLISGIGVGVVNFFIGVMVSIYLLIDKDFFLRLWRHLMDLLFSEKRSGSINGTLSEINIVTSKFMRGVLLDATSVGVLSAIGLTASGLEFGVFLGAFAGICNVIPYFGPIIGMVPAFLIGFVTDGFWHGVIAVVILFVVQQIDVTFIYPRVVGQTTGLHPLFVLLAVSVGGFYWGLVGMVVAVPIAGIIQIFVHRWVAAKEEKKNTEEAAADEMLE